MDPSVVLSQYIDICNSESLFLQYHLSKNSVLEWFGRTIRGRHKIQQFLRYDIGQQYEHMHFDSVQICEPIESRAAHMQTKVFADEDYSIEESRNGADSIETTPPQQKQRYYQLPPITRGKEFLPLDEDNLGITLMTGSISPPSPKTPTDSELSNEEPFLKRKRPSIDLGSKNVALPNVDDYFKAKNKNQISLHSDRYRCTSQSFSGTTTAQDQTIPDNNAIDLIYIEARGTIKKKLAAKHKGVYTSTFIPSDSPSSNTSHSERVSERETMLKISYRVDTVDQHIQFALIIYEQISRIPGLRRNLLSSFNDNNVETSKSSENSPKPSAPIRRKTPLKRNLRLF